MFSRSEKYLVEQRENWQRTHRQDRAWLLLLWNMVSAFKFCHFVRNSSNKCCFVALLFVMIDHCSASVQAACEPIISTSILIIKRNKHEWTSEGLLFKPLKDINTHHFSSSSPLTLIYSPVWFVCRNKMADSALWLVRYPANQAPYEGSVDVLVFCLYFICCHFIWPLLVICDGWESHMFWWLFDWLFEKLTHWMPVLTWYVLEYAAIWFLFSSVHIEYSREADSGLWLNEGQ